MIFRTLCIFLLLSAGYANADGLADAEYAEPTTRYAHGILGDAIEHGTLSLTTETGRRISIVLPRTRVFEDTSPRLFDVDGDGDLEAIVVESDLRLGARLAIYDERGLVSANDFIGRSNRWLAPVGMGAADLDGDGNVEIAFVDRPHLAKTLRIFRFAEPDLQLVAELPGVTNHKIGERDIAGGIRDCGDGPEIIVADANWRRVLALRFDGKQFETRALASHQGRSTFAAAMDCKI